MSGPDIAGAVSDCTVSPSKRTVKSRTPTEFRPTSVMTPSFTLTTQLNVSSRAPNAPRTTWFTTRSLPSDAGGTSGRSAAADCGEVLAHAPSVSSAMDTNSLPATFLIEPPGQFPPAHAVAGPIAGPYRDSSHPRHSLRALNRSCVE